MLYLGGKFLDEECLKFAAQIATKTGCRLVTDTFVSRIRRGAGLPIVQQVPYFSEMAEDFLQGTESIVFIGTKPPVSFFAYPDKKSFLSPDEAELFELCSVEENGYEALALLSELSGSPKIASELIRPHISDVPTSGDLDVTTLGPLIADMMPEESIVSDESATSSLIVTPHALQAKPHDWLALTGGSIGQGLPLAIAVASVSKALANSASAFNKSANFVCS
jgi:acetolactate synthase-1/2/3 large subunit